LTWGRPVMISRTSLLIFLSFSNSSENHVLNLETAK